MIEAFWANTWGGTSSSYQPWRDVLHLAVNDTVAPAPFESSAERRATCCSSIRVSSCLVSCGAGPTFSPSQDDGFQLESMSRLLRNVAVSGRFCSSSMISCGGSGKPAPARVDRACGVDSRVLIDGLPPLRGGQNEDRERVIGELACSPGATGLKSLSRSQTLDFF